ncbi:MAG TPA: HlyD family secretion protein [Bryobacteraceae bacterium]|jgi:membrane fusion protein (multidrug efflux system)|nr:HlyD family secretion protein [Bryobacteraceae bacterium]
MSNTYEIQEPVTEPRENSVKPAPPSLNGAPGKKDKSEQKSEDTSKRKRALLIFAAVVVLAAIAGLFYWLHARQFEDTDDAQIDGNLSPIGTRIDGSIIKVYVQNNQLVKIGDPLVDLDPRDNQVSLDQAEAQVRQARSLLSSQRPNVPITEVQNSTNILSARADVAAAQAAIAAAERDRDQAAAEVVQQEAAANKAQNDLKRYKILVDKQEISKADFDQYESNAKQEAANLVANQSALSAAERTIDQRRAQLDQSKSKLMQNEQTAVPQLLVRRATVDQQIANLKSAEAQLEQARLNFSYTSIKAAVAGIVMKRAAQVGSHVQAGQQLLTISEIGNLWVTANFKETQLLHMRPGQRVTVHVDSLDLDFRGSVETIGGSTGSVASTLPPENATGNYVKVVQRIPVRIALDANQEGANRLRPGMSVEPSVHVGE